MYHKVSVYFKGKSIKIVKHSIQRYGLYLSIYHIIILRAFLKMLEKKISRLIVDGCFCIENVSKKIFWCDRGNLWKDLIN